MTVLTGYIARAVLKSALIALLFLLALFNVFTLSDELQDMGKGQYDLMAVFQYVLLTSPRVFYELVPSSALLGSLFALGNMANDRELIAMRAAGWSVLQIIQAVLLAGAVLATLAVLVGEWVAPASERAAQILRSTAQGKQFLVQGQSGLWLREGQQFINIKSLTEAGELQDVRIYRYDARQQLQQMITAERGVFQQSGRWLLESAHIQRLNGLDLSQHHYPTLDWPSSINPKVLDVVTVSPENMSLYDLGVYVNFLQKNQQRAQVFELAFWSRLINPLVIFVMLMVSAPFVIGVKRGINFGTRLMIGVGIGLTFNIVDKMVGHLSVIYHWNPLLMTLIPSMMMLVFALYAMRKVV
ncbi:MAG: LPS export ABC transporter permease LptG [Methylococcales bacterium]|nr:LPS export ABC transporter permease LptG [Methylococcales bacterium]